ncbi:hypothetical protein GC173_05865 [bacterium]|nr:hypothetical protein [bacterium]
MISLSQATIRERTRRLLLCEFRPDGAMLCEYAVGSAGARQTAALSAAIPGDPCGPDAATFGAQLRLLMQEHKLRGGACLVLVPLSWVVTHSFETPALSDADLQSMITLEAEKVFPFGPSEQVLGNSVIRPSESAAVVTLVAMQATRLDALERALRGAGLGPVAIAVQGFDDSTEAASARLLTGPSGLLLSVSQSGSVVALRHLCDATALGDLAEPARRADLVREVKMSLRALPQALGAAPTAIVLEWDQGLQESQIAPLAEQFRKSGFDLQSRRVTEGEQRVRLIERWAKEHRLAVNLLRPRLSRWERTFRAMNRRGLLVRAVAGAGTLVALVALLFLYRGWRASSLESQWSRMESDVAVVEGLEQDIRAWRAWYNPAVPTLDLMKSLTEAFPSGGDVYTKTLQIRDQREVICTGTAKRREDFVKFQEKLGATAGVSGLQVQQLRGEEPVQFSLTFRWAGRGGA